MVSNLNELNPEVLKMLEDMTSKKKESTSSKKRKINLSDKEFGKY